MSAFVPIIAKATNSKRIIISFSLSSFFYATKVRLITNSFVIYFKWIMFYSLDLKRKKFYNTEKELSLYHIINKKSNARQTRFAHI